MTDKRWGHCGHCRFFASPAQRPLASEEARCVQPELARFQLVVFGSGGCNAFELRQGLRPEVEQPGIVG